MTNYDRLKSMSAQEMANWYCTKFIIGFQFFSWQQQAEIMNSVLKWLNEESLRECR